MTAMLECRNVLEDILAGGDHCCVTPEQLRHVLSRSRSTLLNPFAENDVCTPHLIFSLAKAQDALFGTFLLLLLLRLERHLHVIRLRITLERAHRNNGTSSGSRRRRA